MRDASNQGAFTFDSLRPMRDHRRANSAFVVELLEVAVRRIRRICPAVTVTLIGVFGTGHDLGQIPWTHLSAVASLLRQVIAFAIRRVFDMTSTIVDGEEDQRILKTIRLLEHVEDSADARVHNRDLSGIDFHASLLPLFMLGVFPCRHIWMPRRQRSVRRNNSQLFHACQPLLPQLVPAHGIFAFVLGDVFFTCM